MTAPTRIRLIEPIRFLSFTLVLFLLATSSFAQKSEEAPSIRVFLDCSFNCDTSYVKQEMPVIDFVTERSQADVHMMHATQRTGSGGSKITLTFLGQRAYSTLSDTLSYSTTSNASSDDERQAFLQYFIIGISRYMAKAGLADRLTIKAVKAVQLTEAPRTPLDDP